jgi:hypothetical protein
MTDIFKGNLMKTLVLPLFAAMCMASGAVHADGLSDLKAALAKAGATTPIKGILEARVTRRIGEGDAASETNGKASIAIADGSDGMTLKYSDELLAQLRAEQAAKARNPELKTPTFATLGELGTGDALSMVSATPRILRSLEKAIFKSERAVVHNGKPARLLSFEIPIETLGKQERKYLKKLDAVLEIWIAPDGTPLASRRRHKVSGSAYVVVRFESNMDEQCVYTLVGDRLVAVRIESLESTSGMGDRAETKSIKTLQL